MWVYIYIYISTYILHWLFVYTYTQHMPNLATASLSYIFNDRTLTKVLEPLYKSYERTYFKGNFLVNKNDSRREKKENWH